MTEMPDSTHFKDNAHTALQDAPLQNALRFVRTNFKIGRASCRERV